VRYLVASDLHYKLQQLDWIAEQAADFDAVILAGDHLDAAGHADLHAQVAVLTAYLGQLADGGVVVANSGNHDLTGRRESGEKAATWLDTVDSRVITDGMSRQVGGDLISVCAWWEGPDTLHAVEQQLVADDAVRPTAGGSGSGRWIWVYHSPPDASPTSWSGRRHYGDDVLNRLIATHHPDIVLTGHVHESPFVADGSWNDRIDGTLVLNAGRQAGPVPAHVIVDTSADEVMWWSFDGSETIPLTPNA
jgi:Icc-related predicted phosphoesterase